MSRDDAQSIDSGTPFHAAMALIIEGDNLVAGGHYGDAIVCYDAVVERWGDTDQQDVRKQIRIALGKKGAALVRMDRFGEVDAAFNAGSHQYQRGHLLDS